MKIEICLESIESVIAAEKGGADRVEFCADLFEGGTTPSLGAFKVAKANSTIAMSVIIRPRGGDFCYSELEFSAMKEDIRLFKEAGADCVVFGILTPDGEIDVKRNKELIELARPMEVTFHRAFDMTPNAKASLETLIGLGFDFTIEESEVALCDTTARHNNDPVPSLFDQGGKHFNAFDHRSFKATGKKTVEAKIDQGLK